MQNIADCLTEEHQTPLRPEEHEALPTFVVFNSRRKAGLTLAAALPPLAASNSLLDGVTLFCCRRPSANPQITSSAKRQRQPGSTKIHQTPDGSFFDLMRNADDVLRMCGVSTPGVGAVDKYLAEGPGFVFLYHPALGPLWSVIARKIQGGVLAEGAELVLECAEVNIRGLELDGSLLVQAEQIMGHWERGPAHEPAPGAQEHHHHQQQQQHYEHSGASAAFDSRQHHVHQPSAPQLHHHEDAEGGSTNGNGARFLPGVTRLYSRPTTQQGGGDSGRLVFSDRAGRIRLENVRVINQGIDRADPATVWWKHQVHRREVCRVVLHGRSEFEAANVTLRGSQTFEVPDGYCMQLVADESQPRGFRMLLHPLAQQPTWEWAYSIEEATSEITLSLVDRTNQARGTSEADLARATGLGEQLLEFRDHPLEFSI